MLLVDASIFLELFLGQEKAEECEKFPNGKLEAIISKFTIHVIEAIINDSALILTFLKNVQNSLGLRFMKQA